MRAHRFAFVLLFVLSATIFVLPLVRGEVFTIRDHSDYFQPLRWFTAAELKAGHLPLWNPYSASGEAWLANPQTGVFYPPAWLFVVLPFPAAYMLFLLAHLVLLGCGAYLLFTRTASQGAALIGAAAVMFCGPVLSLVDVNNNLATLAWLPLVLWCAAERSWRLGAAALAMAFLGGEPFFAGVAAVLFVVVAGRSWKTTALAGLATIGLTAVQLFPFLEAISYSDRATGMSPDLILRDSMPLADWLRVAIPRTFTTLDASLGQRFIPVVYCGIVVCVLALIGLASIRRKHVAGWAALLAVAIVIGSGPALLVHLPLTLFRYPARMVPLGALALAGLAVAGWERIRRTERRWLDLVIVLVVVADLLPRSIPLLHTAPFSKTQVPYAKSVGADLQFIRAGAVSPAQRANWIAGYLNLYDRRFDTNTAAPFASATYLDMHRKLMARPRPEQLAFLSAGYVLATTGMPRSFTPLARAGEVTVWRNPGAWPMARFVSKSRARAAQWEVTTSSARIVVDAPENGTVVLAQQIVPGWRVTVDGKPATPRRIEGVFRGVEVAKGRHEIVWSYRPWTLFAGAGVTLITLAGVLLFRQIACRVKRFE